MESQGWVNNISQVGGDTDMGGDECSTNEPRLLPIFLSGRKLSF